MNLRPTREVGAVTIGEQDVGPRGVARVWSLVHGSRFASPSKRWAECVITITPEGARCISRAQLAAELEDADLGALAHEVIRRKVPRGCVLAFLVAEPEGDDPVVRFVVVDLLGKARP